MMLPLGICSSEKTANCELPPPAGSTAIVTWLVLASPIGQKMSTGMSLIMCLKKRSTSPDGKALDCASAQMPICAAAGRQQAQQHRGRGAATAHRFAKQHGLRTC